MKKIPRKCPKCKGKRVQTETGREFYRHFSDGVLVSESSKALPRRVFCRDCYHEFTG